MTVPRDVEGRLAQGRPVVADFDEYVRACQQLGYAHPDLTGRAGQVYDWYATEDGLRLEALSADTAALNVIAQATDHAVRRQAELAAGLAAAWSGRGAETAVDFLARTQRAAATADGAVREAAETLTSLSDALWSAVDAKVGATLAIESGRRADWLAAARTVTSGAGDRAGASELVDQQVKPFVEDVIGVQWVTAMRSATAAVEDAYRAALARLQATTGTVFEVPGQLGPRWAGSVVPGEAGARVESGVAPTPSVSAAPAAVAPAAFSAPPSPSVPSIAEPAASQPLPQTDASAIPGSPLGDVGSLGSGASGSGLSGFGQQLADLIGGLLGGTGDDGAELDPLGSDDPADPDDPDDLADEDSGDEDAEDETDDEDEGPPDPPAPTDPAVAAPAPPPAVTVAAEPVPTPVPPEIPPPAVDSAAPPPPAPTPCEIAADELPQVGE